MNRQQEADQIAAEAAELWFIGEDALGRKRQDQAALRDIIKAAIEKAKYESFGLCLSHRAAYRLSNPDKCPICRLLEEMHEIESRAAQGSECNHQWTDYGTLHMPEQGPPLEIEACVRCGVQRKKR